VTAVLEEQVPTEPPRETPPPRRPSLIHRFGLEALLGVAAFVFFAWGLSKNGLGNDFYAASVRSMTQSWHNFIYGAYDPGGWITTDKPPFALWLQAASARVFGFSTWSLLLPSVACGAASVVLLAATVRRVWGRTAGLAAGAALAVMPVVLAVSRSNNPDVSLMLCMVAAAYATQRAISERKPWWLVLAGVFCGFGFLAKLLVAGFVMPGLWLAYLVTGPGSVLRRIRDLFFATLAFLGVAAAWVLLFLLTPASNRPWVGGSTNGSALDLVFGYDGFGRVFGARGQAGGGRFGGGGGFGFGGGAGGINQFGGTPGLGRLFNLGMGDQVMWVVLFAAAALIGGVAIVVRRRVVDDHTGSLIIFGGWALVSYPVLAYAKGTFHNYYVAALAPAVAGLCGIGVGLVRRGGRSAAALLAASALATAWLARLLLGRVDAYQPLRVVVPLLLALVAAGAIVLGLAGEARGKRVQGLAVAALIVALVPSFIWAYNGTRVAQNATFPDARPAAGAAGGFGGLGQAGRFGGGGASTAELAWLKQNSPGARWVLAVSSSMQADSAIVDGYSVMAIGGFSGSDPSMTTAKLADLVAAGKLRFVSGGGGFGGFGGFGGGGPGGFGGRGSSVTSAVASVCTPVSPSEWGDAGTSGVYDCRGKAEALRTAA
jgi:4-amino-4-deoxy-L-arabinose transferase-like glycosyltransferase